VDSEQKNMTTITIFLKIFIGYATKRTQNKINAKLKTEKRAQTHSDYNKQNSFHTTQKLIV